METKNNEDPIYGKDTAETSRAPLAHAIHELSECFGYRTREREVIPHIQRAIRYATEALGNLRPAPTLTEMECDVSSALHTYLRKYEDTHISCILYLMISEDRATSVWYAFVQAVAAGKKAKIALQEANTAADDSPTDGRIFWHALEVWNEEGGMEAAIKECAPKKGAA